MTYATFGDLTLADGLLTKDTDSDYVAIPLRSVDAASMTHKSNQLWIAGGVLALIFALLLLVNDAGAGAVGGFAVTGFILFAIYASSRRSVVSVRAGAIEVTSEVAGNNREVAEEFVKTVAAAAQWTGLQHGVE